MTARPADPPAWPAMMDLPLALAYTTLKEGAFRAVMARAGVQPVDLGLSILRWRRADLDGAIDRLPLKPTKSRPDATEDSPPPAVHLVDPAAEGLERIRRRAGRR